MDTPSEIANVGSYAKREKCWVEVMKMKIPEPVNEDG